MYEFINLAPLAEAAFVKHIIPERGHRTRGFIIPAGQAAIGCFDATRNRTRLRRYIPRWDWGGIEGTDFKNTLEFHAFCGADK